MSRVFVTDCEGPISKNDNAFELTEKFIPNGGKLFQVISKYDDVLADITKKEGYAAGDTLSLILPFFHAYGIRDSDMEDFSAKNISLVPGAKDTLVGVCSSMPSFMISTSYEHYIRPLCNLTGFPFENTYSTKAKLSRYESLMAEKYYLQDLAQKISKMPVMEIPKSNKFEDFSKTDKKNIKKLDEIFWNHIAQIDFSPKDSVLAENYYPIGRVLKEVKPIGGPKKADAIDDIIKKTGTKLSDVMYVGDSITDVQAFRKVREEEGLTVSFNGNNYAVREAEIAVLSGNTNITSFIADAFRIKGKMGVYNLISGLNTAFSDEGRAILNPAFLPKVELVTSENMEALAKESSAFRKTVRGVSVGQLG